MSTMIAFAKTTRPSYEGVLQRDRLFKSLDRRCRSPLVWVAAPAGSGKTTLASSYLEARRVQSIWYHLDAGDEDIGTFFHYMSATARERRSEFGRWGLATACDGWSGEQLPAYGSENQSDPKAFARRYFRAFFATFRDSFTIVLDNHQILSADSLFHDVMVIALEELPPQGCIMVLSRVEPPASMARLRANRRIELLGWLDLKLTRDEADAIVERSGAPCSEVYLEQLHEKTGGWAAGLILMLDQTSSPSDVTTQCMDPSAPQVVFDYLAGEIFGNFDKSTQNLLLTTAYLPEMTAIMAAEISGESGAAELLAELHHNYHLVGRRPDPQAPIYHCHPLLSELLHTQLRSRRSPAERRELRRRSAVCLENYGGVGEAINLTAAASDWREFARLINNHAEAFIRQGRTETVEGWLALVPEAQCDVFPELDLWHALCRAHSSPREARLLFERAYSGLHKQARSTSLAACRSVAGILDTILSEGDDFSLLDPWLAVAQAQLRAVAETGCDTTARLAVSFVAALAEREPSHADMGYWRDEAAQRLSAAKDVVLRYRGQARLAVEMAVRGQVAAARESMQQLTSKTRAQEWSRATARIIDDANALVSSYGDDLDSCMEAVQTAFDNADEVDDKPRAYGLLVQAMLAALAARNTDLANELDGRLQGLQVHGKRTDRCRLAYARSWLAMLKGDSVEAVDSQRTAVRLAREVGQPTLVTMCRAALVSLRLKTTDNPATLEELKRLRRRARAAANPRLHFQLLTQVAGAYLDRGKRRLAERAVKMAFEVGQASGLRTHFWWHDESMARLCAFALEARVEVDYARQLVRSGDLPPPAAAQRSTVWPWRFQFFTMGDDGFRVLRDGKPLGVTARLQQKPLDLLKSLIALGGVRVPEARLTEVMWPRIDADSAHRSLTTTLHRLRKLLGEDQAVILRFGRLSLNERYCWTDVSAFEAVTTAADHESTGPSYGAPVELDTNQLAAQVLSCYRGPFLNDEGEQDRYQSMRLRLRNRLLRVAGELTRRWAEEGDWNRCFQFLSQAIEADSQLEGLYRRLMLCYRDAGLATEAMDVYEQCRRACHGPDDTDASPETAAIFNLVLQAL